MFLNSNAMLNSLGNPFRDIYYVLPAMFTVPQVPIISMCCGASVVKITCEICNYEYIELRDSLLNTDPICNVCMEKECADGNQII